MRFKGLIFFALTAMAYGQSANDRCLQGQCQGFGPPIGLCTTSSTYQDISQNPVQAYSCKAGAWVAQGGSSGGGATLPSSGIVRATSPTTSVAASSSDIQNLIGSGVYDPANAATNAVGGSSTTPYSIPFVASPGTLGALSLNGLPCFSTTIAPVPCSASQIVTLENLQMVDVYNVFQVPNPGNTAGDSLRACLAAHGTDHFVCDMSGYGSAQLSTGSLPTVWGKTGTQYIKWGNQVMTHDMPQILMPTPASTIVTATTSTTSGVLPAGTYTFRTAWAVTPLGATSVASADTGTFTLSSAGQVTFTAGACPTTGNGQYASSANVYIGVPSTFTASISGNTMTVTALGSNNGLAIGGLVTIAGGTNAHITSLGSAMGGIGTGYILDGSAQTISSETMTESAAGGETLQMNLACSNVGAPSSTQSATNNLAFNTSFAQPPTTALGVPPLIQWGTNHSGMYADIGNQGQGLKFIMGTGASNSMMETVGNGYTSDENFFFQGNGNLTGPVWMDQGYFGSVRRNLNVNATNNVGVVTFGESSDIYYNNVVFSGGVTASNLCGYGWKVVHAPMNFGDRESNQQLTLTGTLQNVGSATIQACPNLFVIQGDNINSMPNGLAGNTTGVNTIALRDVNYEMSHGLTAGRVIDAQNVLLDGGQVNNYAFNQTANFTATASGNTLTVSSLTNGTITVGTAPSNALYGIGVPKNTFITAQGTGTGGTGTYTLSNSASISTGINMVEGYSAFVELTQTTPAATGLGAMSNFNMQHLSVGNFAQAIQNDISPSVANKNCGIIRNSLGNYTPCTGKYEWSYSFSSPSGVFDTDDVYGRPLNMDQSITTTQLITGSAFTGTGGNNSLSNYAMTNGTSAFLGQGFQQGLSGAFTFGDFQATGNGTGASTASFTGSRGTAYAGGNLTTVGQLIGVEGKVSVNGASTTSSSISAALHAAAPIGVPGTGITPAGLLIENQHQGTVTTSYGVKINGPLDENVGFTNIRSGNSANTDIAGILTLSGGTATYTFAQTYTSSLVCTATDTSALAAVRVQVSTTTLTVTGTGTDVVNYLCIGRN